MRIAICLFGKAGGMSGQDGVGDPVDIEACANSYYKHIFETNPPPHIFIHSWSVEKKEEILRLYRPISHLIEPQIVFSEDKVINQFRSRWYSTKKVLELKKAYETEVDIKYDCVMVLRFDAIFHTDLIFKDYDLNFFWASVAPNRDQFDVLRSEGKYMQDFWFFSNSKAMDWLGKISDNYLEGNCHKVAYEHINQKYQIKYTLMSARDFDLYRWYKGTDTNVPGKWYVGITR